MSGTPFRQRLRTSLRGPEAREAGHGGDGGRRYDYRAELASHAGRTDSGARKKSLSWRGLLIATEQTIDT